jgi:predicted membrane protein
MYRCYRIYVQAKRSQHGQALRDADAWRTGLLVYGVCGNLSHGMKVAWYLVLFAAIMAIGVFFAKEKKLDL